MKKLASSVLAFCFTFMLFSPAVSAAGLISRNTASLLSLPTWSRTDLEKLPAESLFDDDFLPASAEWLAATAARPAARMTAEVTLADGAIDLSTPVASHIADMGQILSNSAVQKLAPNRIIEKGGYIERNVLDAAVAAVGGQVGNGSIVVDRSTGTAFKVVSPTIYTGVFDSDPELKKLMQPLETTYTLTKPELHEVVDNFSLPSQKVALAEGNITRFAPNVEAALRPRFLQSQSAGIGQPPSSTVPPASGTGSPSSGLVPLAVGGEDKGFKTLVGDNLIELQFKDTPLQGKVGNSTINVKLSGGIAIAGIELEGRYSGMGGYEIAMTLQQECYLVTELDAEVHENIRIPLLGLDIPFGIGSIYGGIFAIIDMNGDFKLGIEARETSACRMGIEGGTFLYVPTSFHPIFDPSPPKFTGDCSMLGKINGSIRFGPMLGIEIFGFDLVAAGAVFGAGVIVESDGKMLDIELYGAVDVYVVLLDHAYTLAHLRPTIYRKQQPDMQGFKASFLETYVSPGRVGGLIEKEPPEAGGAYIPAIGLDYRVWTVPKNAVSGFQADTREAILQTDRANTQKALKDKVRTYPADGFAKINAEGEFFQEDSQICFGDDQIYLEFKNVDKEGKISTFFVGPAKPTLPYKRVTITGADYFNDYITGKVEPTQVINWQADRFNPDEVQTQLVPYVGPVDISPFNDYSWWHQDLSGQPHHQPYTISGTAFTGSDEHGEFDSRASNPVSGVGKASGSIDVLTPVNITLNNVPQVVSPGHVGVVATLKVNGAANNIIVYGIVPTAPEFQYTRTRNFVPDSWKRIPDGDRIFEQMAYDEYLWIANPTGTRTITPDMVECTVKGFSSQDYKGYYENPVKEMREGPIKLTPVLDDQGQPTGSALLAQRITVEWVWQAHPNPIRITSTDHTETVAGLPSSFQVKADGYLPRFSVIGQPAGVTVDEKTGVMTLPPTLAVGSHAFTIQAKEGVALTQMNGPDPKLGNDASKPDEQLFTLVVMEKPAETTPSVTASPTATGPAPSPSAPSPSATSPSATSPSATGATTTGPSASAAAPTPTPRVAPKIAGRISLAMTSGIAGLTEKYTATGSTPITFSVAVTGGSFTGAPLPAGAIGIHAGTGILTVGKTVPAGSYTLTITAGNDVGKSSLACALKVSAPVPPAFTAQRDGYVFTMFRGADYKLALGDRVAGTRPIAYSLEPVNPRLPVASQITINPETGELTVPGGLVGGIPLGTYDFRVRAANIAGSATQDCRLTVSYPGILPPIRQLAFWQPIQDLAIGLARLATGAVPSSAQAAGIGQMMPGVILNPGMFNVTPPPNKVTLRCDDPKDVYTHDRETINGALYIGWDISLKLKIVRIMNETTPAGHEDYEHDDFAEWGDEYEALDPTPVCDNYHYDHPDAIGLPNPMTAEQIAAMKAKLKQAVAAEIAQYQKGYLSQDDNAGGLRDRYQNFRVNPMDTLTSSLEYGALTKEISGAKGGAFTVDLTPDTGTVVVGEYFTSLLSNRQAAITFQQQGARITFAGQDIAAGDIASSFNIGLCAAPHETAIMDGIGSGAQSVTYGFQYHGSLPGVATFAIATPLAEGTVVNVYRFDAGNGQFTLIAGSLKTGAGGIVTYKNSTMSEYVITTKTIGNAAVSPLASLQGTSGLGAAGAGWLIIAAGGSIGVLLLCVLAWLLLLRRRQLPVARLSAKD